MINPHPGLPEFDYVKPASLQEACQFLAEHAGESRPLSGGTDIFVRMRDGAWTDKYLVDIKGLDGMNALVFDPKKGLTIGSAVNMNRVASNPEVKENYPLLADAARTVASYQLRTRATIVGNICNASPAGDSVGACLAYEGVLQVQGVDGERSEPLATFFKGPGKNVLKPGDIVTSVFFPLPPEGHAGKYIKLGRNALSDLAIVGATALGYPDANTASGFSFRIYLASVAPTPARSVDAEAVLAGKPVSAESIAEAAQAAMDACKPIDDVRGTARYRQYMVRNLVRQAVSDVWSRINQS